MSETQTPETEEGPPPTGWARIALRLEDWLVWLAVTGVAWMAALSLAVAAVETILRGLPGWASLPLARLAGGALLGLLQWAYLARGRAKLPHFLLTSALAWPLALLGYDLLVGPTQSALAAALGGLLGGALMGFVQGRALTEKAEQHIWLAHTIAGWTLALALGRQAVYDEVIPAANTWQYSVPLGIGWVFLALLAVIAIVLVFPRKRLSLEEMKLPMWPKR